jgi:hypothetical protein
MCADTNADAEAIESPMHEEDASSSRARKRGRYQYQEEEQLLRNVRTAYKLEPEPELEIELVPVPVPGGRPTLSSIASGCWCCTNCGGANTVLNDYCADPECGAAWGRM